MVVTNIRTHVAGVPDLVVVSIQLVWVVGFWAVVRIVFDPIVVHVGVTSVSTTIFVSIFLPRVGKIWAIVGPALSSIVSGDRNQIPCQWVSARQTLVREAV